MMMMMMMVMMMMMKNDENTDSRLSSTMNAHEASRPEWPEFDLKAPWTHVLSAPLRAPGPNYNKTALSQA